MATETKEKTVRVKMLQGMGSGESGLAYNLGDTVEVSPAAAKAWIEHGVAEAAPPEQPRSTTRRPPRTGQIGPKPK